MHAEVDEYLYMNSNFCQLILRNVLVSLKKMALFLLMGPDLIHQFHPFIYA